MLKVFLLLSLLTLTPATTQSHTFTVFTNETVRSVPREYGSFTFDWWESTDPVYGEKWQNAGILTVDLSNPDLIALTTGIAPAFLRIGGSPEDSIIYNTSNNNECGSFVPVSGYQCSQVSPQNYGCLTMDRWEQINIFASKTNVSLVFGLNACYGRLNRSSAMDTSNIESLIAVTTSPDFVSTALYGFELGNELNNRIDADAYANDFIVVQQIVTNAFKEQQQQQQNVPKMMGPDTGAISSYIEPVLKGITNNSMNTNIIYAATFHEYVNCIFKEDNISVFQMECLDSIPSTSDSMSALASKYHTKSWMGEGAEHSGGGIINVTNVFASSFYYLFHLCEAISHNVTVVARQCLMGGDYELVNKTTIKPNPDYWMLWLWKYFIGHRVIKYAWDSSFTSSDTYRGYVFSHSNDSSSLTLIFINFALYQSVEIQTLVEGHQNPKFTNYFISGHLQSDTIAVNGKPLKYNSTTQSFPVLKGVTGNGTLRLQPTSMAFVVCKL